MAAGCAKVFQEKVSGAKTDRPELAKVLRRLEPGDILVVTRLDRLARSTRDLLNIIAAVAERGAGFRSLRDAWADTTSPHGRLMLTVLGGLAEFERELIRARTGEGRRRAKDRGVKFGAPASSPRTSARRPFSALRLVRRKPTWLVRITSTPLRSAGYWVTALSWAQEARPPSSETEIARPLDVSACRERLTSSIEVRAPSLLADIFGHAIGDGSDRVQIADASRARTRQRYEARCDAFSNSMRARCDGFPAS